MGSSLRCRTAKAGAGWLIALLATSGSPSNASPPPWEVWRDLRMIAELPIRDQVLMRSSHCPDGCRYDRHSAGDSRFLYVDGEEGVIFDEPGAGAVTRIWTTMGMGTSDPLDPSIGVRIYVDGASTPVIDAPLPALFDGTMPPFVPPLVGDRLVSSGGNFSYVPIPYQNGCKIALVGAELQRIWFQIGFHRLTDPNAVTSFTGSEDLTDWADLLNSSGGDPWPLSEAGLAPGTSTLTEHVALVSGAAATVAYLAGPDLLTALRVRTPTASLSTIEIQIIFDGEERVRMPLADFFAVGRDPSAPTRSLFFGLDDEDFLYCYAPMPFFASAEIMLRHLGAPVTGSVEVEVEVRHENRPPPSQSGIFGAELRSNDPTTLGFDAPLLSLEGHGKWFGLFSDLGSFDTPSRQYLEGDERVYLDGSPHPAVYGTGVEDFFNGGFYFDQGPFLLALHGSPYHWGAAQTESGEDVTAAYRWMPTDAVTFERECFAGVEVGPLGNLQMRARTVAYYYLRWVERLDVADTLDLDDPDSRTAHAHTIGGPHSAVLVDSYFEGEPPLVPYEATSFERPPGVETFRLRPNVGDTLFRLRRRFDSAHPGQGAEIRVAGDLVARFPVTFPNPFRRWQEMEVDLPAGVLPDEYGDISFEIRSLPAPGDLPAGTYSAGVYELSSGHPIHTLDYMSAGPQFKDDQGSFITAGSSRTGGFIQLLAVGTNGYGGFVDSGDGVLGDDFVVGTSYFGENVPIGAHGSFVANPIASSVAVGQVFVLRFFNAPSPAYVNGTVPDTGFVGVADLADHTIGVPSGVGPLTASEDQYDQWVFDSIWSAEVLTPVKLLRFTVE